MGAVDEKGTPGERGKDRLTRSGIDTGSLAARFSRSCVYVFGGVVLLIWAVELLCRYGWMLALASVMALLVAVGRWYRQRWGWIGGGYNLP